jgi:hypothetical protein
MMGNDIREGMPSDNAASIAGYTQEIALTSDECDLYLLIKPGTDLDSRFKAWDTDNQEWLVVNGWLFTEFDPS